MRHAGLIDWVSIRAEYQENRIPVRALARRYRISDTAIHKRAAAEKWARKPAPDQVRHGSPSANLICGLSAAQKKRTDTDSLASLSSTKAPTLTSAQLVRHARAIIEAQLRELGDITERIGEMEEEIIKETNQDADGRRRHAMLRAVSLATRSLAAKNLAQAIKTLSNRGAPKLLGKKEQRQRDAEFLATNGPFAVLRLPPRNSHEEVG